MSQLSIVLFMSMIFAGSFAAAEPLKSPKIKKSICEFLAAENPPLDSSESMPWNYDITKRGVEIDENVCLKAKADVSASDTKKLGSKTYVVGLDVTISSEDWTCQVAVSRQARVDLSEDNRPIITVTSWSVSEALSADRLCTVNATQDMLDLDFDQRPSGVTYTQLKTPPAGMYIPEHLELGEPDDGTAGVTSTEYEVKKGGKLIGYVSEYWVANSESESAVRFILKYNARGVWLTHLIDRDDADFCEFPFSQDDMPEQCR